MKNPKAAPPDLGDLQVTFDALLDKHGIDRASPRADDIATTLLIGRKYGIAGLEELIAYVEAAAGLIG